MSIFLFVSEAIFRQLWPPRDYINVDPLHFWIGPFTFNHCFNFAPTMIGHNTLLSSPCSPQMLHVVLESWHIMMNVAWVESSGCQVISKSEQLLYHCPCCIMTIAKQPCICRMNPNTPWAKAPWVQKLCSFRIHFCFWDSIACLRPLGGRLISLLLYAFVLGRFTVWFCVVGLVAPRPKGSISVKDVGWFMGSAHSVEENCVAMVMPVTTC